LFYFSFISHVNLFYFSFISHVRAALEVCSRQGAIQIHVYLTLPYVLLSL